jgi:hypothetical protein
LEINKQRDEWFISILNKFRVGMKSYKYVEYHNSKGELMVQNIKDGMFYFSYDLIWKVLEKKYNMKYPEIQSYIKKMVLSHLKWKIISDPLLFCI